MYVCHNIQTLNDIKSCTMQVSVASRPTGVVTLLIGPLNLGSAVEKVKIHKKEKNESIIMNILKVIEL